MSWGEVKQFLNKEKKPLNEIIREVVDLDHGVFAEASMTLSNTSETTILSITGSGKLYRAAMGYGVGSNGSMTITLKITVDDEKTYSVACKADNTYSTIGCGFLPSIVLSDSISLPISKNYCVTLGVGAMAPLTETPLTYTGAGYCSLVIFPDYIRFRKSIKVTAKQTAAATMRCGVVYELLD